MRTVLPFHYRSTPAPAVQEAAARSQAEEACTEAVSQVCSWLDGTERLLAAEPSSWLSATELKTKLQKIKVRRETS